MEGVVGEPNHVGHAPGGKRRRSFNRKGASFSRWSVAVFLRLFFWYTLATAVFRCPSNPEELDGLSPRACEPYLTVRSHVEPLVVPYYDAYAGPYVDAVRPYAQNFNKNIYGPSKSFATRTYRSYGAPRLEQGSQFLQTRWEMIVTPWLHSARDSVIQGYGVAVRPYIRQMNAVVVPRYQAVSSFVTGLQKTYVAPLYMRIERGAGKAYNAVDITFSRYVSPWIERLWSILATFVNDTVWPRISGLYAENIEPQLVRIGQKLASYREEKVVHRMTDEVEDTTTATAVSTSSATSPSSTVVDTTTVDSSDADTSATSSEAPSHSETTRPQVAADLQNWQERFAVAADKGCEDLEEQVVGIVGELIEAGLKKKGEDRLSALEEVAQNELDDLKTKVRDTVRSLPREPTPADLGSAEEQLLDLLRSTGISVREPAHALRHWHDEYDTQLVNRVAAAVASTLEVLDNIRDLGLQEIGMRWAWMDGVTYKDWAKYHALKQQFSEWRGEVNEVGMRHQSLVNARTEGNEILARGMEIAEATAKELVRLKDVGKWKVEAGDDSDNFDTPTTDPAEFRAAQRASHDEEEGPLSGAPEETTPAAEEQPESESSLPTDQDEENASGHPQPEPRDTENDDDASEGSQTPDPDELLSSLRDTLSSSFGHEPEASSDQADPQSASPYQFSDSDPEGASAAPESMIPIVQEEPESMNSDETVRETPIFDDNVDRQFHNARERLLSLSEEAKAHLDQLNTESSPPATEDVSDSATSPTDTIKDEL